MSSRFSRRKFLQTTTLAGMALAVQPRSFGTNLLAGRPPEPGLQLWSVRDALAKDAAGTLKALAAMGYRNLEGFGFDSGKLFGVPARDGVKMMKDNGLNMISTHCALHMTDYDAAGKALQDNAKKIMDEAAALGVQYVIQPWLGEAERAEMPQLVNLFQAAASYAKKAGTRFAYHNHDFEFTQRGPDGRLLIEWLLHETDPTEMDFEMDLYWVAFAEYSPLDWFRIYPNRWKLCHVKDMAKTPKRETVEVGDGSIDFNAIFKQRQEAGFQHYIIELEHYKTDSVQGVNRARENFLKLDFA